jgi:uncharacterized membrane protein
MFRRTRGNTLQKNAMRGAELASALARDRKFRKELLWALRHGTVARRRAASRVGLRAAARRMSEDAVLRRELRELSKRLDNAWSRVEKKRSHRLRNFTLVVGVGGAAAAIALPQTRRKLAELVGGRSESGERTITEAIAVDVPLSRAYNQWTQFEEFPLFMDGVEDVRQLDDTRLHWVATVAGKRAEWDAKIHEQHPDRRISWISQDGKETRGTVSFEPLGEARTLVRLAMTYRREGMLESLGSAAGLDKRRVRGDLERFKELIERRGAETGGWRGEVAAGARTS